MTNSNRIQILDESNPVFVFKNMQKVETAILAIEATSARLMSRVKLFNI